MTRHVIRPQDRWSFALMPKCHVCRRPASHGRNVCFRHAGRGNAHAMTNPHKRAEAVLRRMERDGLVPVELARLAVWQDLRAQQFHGAQRAKRLLERYCERDVDPSGWIRALRHANG